MTYGQFASGGQPGERSDSMTFTVLPSTPTLTFERSSAGWISTPEADLSAFSTVRVQLEFLVDDPNDEFPDGEFLGGSGGGDPAAELQLSTSGGGDIAATPLTGTFTAFPSGTAQNGDTLRWDVTIDLDGWPAGATQFTVRPVADNLGTGIASSLTLQSSTVTINP